MIGPYRKAEGVSGEAFRVSRDAARSIVDFLLRARQEKEIHKEAGDAVPFAPSKLLAEEYQLILPLGGCQFGEVREMAQIFGLPLQ